MRIVQDGDEVMRALSDSRCGDDDDSSDEGDEDVVDVGSVLKRHPHITVRNKWKHCESRSMRVTSVRYNLVIKKWEFKGKFTN